LQLLCIPWDAQRICRLFLIFRYLLRPEMMVIYIIQHHMDFLPKTAHLQGGDTRKAPKNTQFSKSRQTPRGPGSPPRYHPQTYLLFLNLSRTKPSQSFLTKIPMGQTPSHLSILSNQNTLSKGCSLIHFTKREREREGTFLGGQCLTGH
jgi:hypothetical protein